MTTNVLIVTSSSEGSVDSVLPHLEDLGGKYFRLNTDQFPDKSSLSLFLLKGRYSGNIHSDSLGDIDLKSIDSVWYRKPMPPDLDPSLGSDHRAFIENEVRATLWSLYTTLDVFWVNPPLLAFYLLEDNKLYQLRAADSVGLIVPDTIISNRHTDVLRFVKEHGGIVAIKSLYSSGFVDDQEQVHLIYTNQITTDDLVGAEEDIDLSPVMIQEYVQKSIELRITVVGRDIFACEIHSQDSNKTIHDWRKYDFENVVHQPHALSEDIKTKLLFLMKKIGLVYGCIDMVLTPSGQYVFLEVNPNGQWGWIEDLTDFPISRSIAKVLLEV